ncbi:oligosaccharide flippase family protein [Nonomuraea sp. NN258]|uniref:oligosaccharide flippase family protein n=1 Tax=Nonomuraea antri TaxID=2730852 RepID=UPI001569AA3E|nr:oligosaccharide flippase family protein [Nonomuraea antri]NRQ32522.1 oligosaccharide flippase family protein [Nonomuraea antri]
MNDKVESIGRKAGRGLRWSLLGNTVTKAASFVMSLVLARLLGAEDFGVYAVALAATQFVMVVKDAGVMAAVIQWRGRLEEISATATVLAFGFATGLYAIFWVGAPYFCALAGSVHATGVVRLLTAVILVEAVTAVRSAALMRRFEHDKLAIANLAGFAVNATLAISLAAAGAGAYSFAGGQVAAAVVTGVIVLALAKVPFRIGWDRGVAGRLLRFGLPSAAGFGLEAVLMNSSFIVVGAVLGEVQLGYYLLAFNVSSWVPGLIGTALRYVSLPSFSRLAEDAASLTEGVRRSVPLLVSVVMPVALVMATLAHPLVAFLYEPRWDPAAGVLRFLAVLMVVRMIISFLAVDILISVGATKATIWLNLGWAAALLPALLVGAHLDGIRGAAIGNAAAAAFVALPLGVQLLRRQGVRLRPVLPGLVRPAVATAAAGVTMVLFTGVFEGDALLELVVVGGTGLLVFTLLAVPGAVLKQLTRRKVST